MNINNPNEQKLVGNLISRDGSKSYKNIEGKCKFNPYDLSDSYLSVMIDHDWDDFTFESPGKFKFFLTFKKGFDPTFFDISELHLHTNKSYTYNTYSSGCVDRLLYYHDKIKHGNLFIKKEFVPDNFRNENRDYYYTIKSKDDINIEEADLIFLMISTMTGSKFFCRYSRDSSGIIVFLNKISKSNCLHIPGSGRLLFPLDFSTLYNLKNKFNSIFLNNILLQYTTFCISSNIRERLILGW